MNAPSCDTTAQHVATIRAAIESRPDIYLIGISGVPGSGKTTLCRALREQLPGSIVVPFDGYHLPRSQLDAEGLRRRGALHTFDTATFRSDMARLRQSREGSFPEFDHAEKDPRPNAVRVTRSTRWVIVEGIYVLLRDIGAEPLFDLRVFLDCDLDVACQRLSARHVESGLAANAAEGHERAWSNDRVNALGILADGCRERAELVLRTG